MKTRWSNSELRNFMQICSSIYKKIGDRIVWHKKVMLDQSGRPISLEMFKRMVNTPERVVLRRPISHEQFERTPKERALIKAYKKDHKNNMKALFGNDWKRLSRKF